MFQLPFFQFAFILVRVLNVGRFGNVGVSRFLVRVLNLGFTGNVGVYAR